MRLPPRVPSSSQHKLPFSWQVSAPQNFWPSSQMLKREVAASHRIYQFWHQTSHTHPPNSNLSSLVGVRPWLWLHLVPSRYLGKRGCDLAPLRATAEHTVIPNHLISTQP